MAPFYGSGSRILFYSSRAHRRPEILAELGLGRGGGRPPAANRWHFRHFGGANGGRNASDLRHVEIGMSNPTTIDQAADEFVDQYGHAAVDVLRARAEAAAELDDELAAETWGKAADAAERKLQEAADPSD